MFKNINGDICEKLEYIPITFFSNTLRVGIIGGGRGAYIKAKTLINSGVNIEVIAQNFIDEFKGLNAKLLLNSYNERFILDKHIIIIAIDDEEVVNEIIEDCNKLSKIYINSTNFKEGMGVIPVKRESENIFISVNTKVGNPKGAIMLADNLQNEMKKYDDFIEFTSRIRNTVTMDKEEKKSILAFINSNDFKYIFDKGKEKIVLDIFYKEKLNGIDFSNKKK